jgi:hypothetical protein
VSPCGTVGYPGPSGIGLTGSFLRRQLSTMGMPKALSPESFAICVTAAVGALFLVVAGAIISDLRFFTLVFITGIALTITPLIVSEYRNDKRLDKLQKEIDNLRAEITKLTHG